MFHVKQRKRSTKGSSVERKRVFLTKLLWYFSDDQETEEKGKIEIEFLSNEDLDRILELLSTRESSE